MEIGRSALGVIAALCVTAGVGGFYLATRGGDAAALETSSLEVTQTEETIAPSDTVVAEAAAGPSVPAAALPAARAERRPAAAPRRPAARETEIPRSPARAQPVADAVEYAPPVADVRPATPPPAAPSPGIEPETPRTSDVASGFGRTGPPEPEYVELVVPAESVLGLQVETSLSSEQAHVEDEVVARVTRDVRVGDRVAIPAGARAHGEVTLVERGGRLRERARLGVRFTSVVLADGTRLPLETDTIYREGDAPGGESAAKIGGGAIGGAIIGGILGGARGAAIGGSIGAGAGTAAVMAGGRNPATLPTGTPVTVRVVTPTTVTVEK
jgi:hypothetical protein